jgi:hypothetical protein
MLKIYPEIEFNAECPNDRAALNITNVLIPGMRCLADATCPTCASNYYIDLPVGQGLWSPIVINQDTAEIYDPLEMTWFSQPLQDGFKNQVTSEIVPIVHKFFEAERIIVVNCLDFLYGHSLLKLLNVQRHLDNSPELGCCVLVPTQLVHLVPDGVAEIWEFPVAIKDGWKWYVSLEKWINQQLAQRRECFLSPTYSHLSNQDYDLGRFVRNLPDIKDCIDSKQPIILFSYREERLWGRNLAAQQHNLQKLYQLLSWLFPNMVFVLVGFGNRNQIPQTKAQVIDLRAAKFDRERDLLWMAYMKAADCAIGVHGSNMLLPSGLAKSTIELVPHSRVGNTVQDFLFPYQKNNLRDTLLFYRMLYGNEALSNISPVDVANMVASVLLYSPLNSNWFIVDTSQTAISKLKADYKKFIEQRDKGLLQVPTFRSLLKQKIKQAIKIFVAK